MSFIKTYGRCYQKFDNPIIKTDPMYIAPTAKENLEYTGEALELLNAGSTNDGVIKYSLDGTNWSTNVPTGTEVQTYTCYWKLEGDANHNDVEQTTISVEIASTAPAVEFVDLGLPSGLKWAKTNVGATNEEDVGLYFAWGETTGYASADARNAALGGTDGFGNTNYANGGASGISADLTLAQDAANVALGESCRMPSKTEFQELYDNTDSEWTTINNVSGRKFMKKSDHSVYVFFPVTGYFNGISLVAHGDYGEYWSALYNSDTAGHNMQFSSSSVYPQYDYYRRYGLAVRAVQSAS